MGKKVIYHISGFDCPNCANKCEVFLNKQDDISEASIDFNNERLYITYKENELSVDQLLTLVHKVEDDDIKLELLNNNKKKKSSIFDKEFFVSVIRISIAIILTVIAKVFFDNHDHFIVAISLYSAASLICLYDIIWKIIKNIIGRRNPIDMNLLITISSLGVIVLGSLIHFDVVPEAPFMIDPFDGALVVILYQIGELLEHIASNKSKAAIASAIDLRAKTANLLKDGKIEVISPESLQIGDKIVVNVGDNIPTDGIVVDGIASLDTSSLTGEPLPLDVEVNKEVLSGMIVKSGSLIIEVKKVFTDSTIYKIMELVENSGEHKSKAEKFISKFARIYTPAVFTIGLIYLLIFGLITSSWGEAIFGCLAILVVSCPCAIVISIPLAFFAGIGLASKHGIVIKGSNYLDAICNIKTLFIDKTGTLTYGDFKISEIKPYNVSEQQLLETLYIGESRSNHPLAKAVLKGVDISEYIGDLKEYNEVPGQGIIAKYKDDVIHVGNREFLEKNSVKLEHFDTSGTSIYVAKNSVFLGYVVLKDVIREDAKDLIENLKKIKVETILLSGDKENAVKEVAQSVGIEKYHHSLLPGDKTKYIEEAISHKESRLVAFAGDGINDTPSIMRADVGYAMGGVGLDMVINNADVILMNDNPNKIYHSIKIARKTRWTATFNIIFSLLVKFTAIVLVLTGVLKQYGMVVAVAADTGLTVLMILHSLSLIYRKI